MIFYRVAKFICAPFVRLIFRVKITGKENFPKEGGYLVCPNHTSLADVVVLAASFKRLLMFMAKKELFKSKIFGWLIRKLGAFPVDRGGADVGAIKNAISLIEQGQLVNIFPQGTRRSGVDPSTTRIKSGVGMIACHTKCGVIPVFIKAKDNHLKAFRRNELIIGKPIEYEEFGFSGDGKEDYDRAARMIFSRVCELGGYEYPAPKNAEGEHLQENKNS
ncbi:MAG: 1-acyl-sn-glycerol-3-phosphate acyltransferase [Clostridia bacterium]|nr:1-acyl-sn-glycerol-3-phosphate acyltransferase [Clostridia bacterium]